MRLLAILGSVVLTLVVNGAGASENYPTRPIKIVVPFAAGAINDTVARLVAERLQKTFSEGVVVENRPGAGGMLGSDFVARAAPDGYNLLIGTDDALSVLPAVKSLPYDAANDFKPLYGFAVTPFVLAVRASLPAKDLAGLIERAKAKPGEIKYASTGAGGVVHVGAALLEDLAKIQLSHVPYRGMAPAVTDVVGGHVDMVLVSPTTIAPYVQSGAVRILAIADERRHPALPDVPTGAELGYDAFLVRTTIGLVAPRGLPDAIAGKLEAELARIGNDEAFKKRLTELGITPNPLSAKDYGKRTADERERWRALAKRVNLEIDK